MNKITFDILLSWLTFKIFILFSNFSMIAKSKGLNLPQNKFIGDTVLQNGLLFHNTP